MNVRGGREASLSILPDLQGLGNHLFPTLPPPGDWGCVLCPLGGQKEEAVFLSSRFRS